MTCVVYVTDGNPSDMRFLIWSARSLLRHSSASFDLIILSRDKCASCSVLESDVERHGSMYVIHNMDDTLGTVGFRRDEWKRKRPFEVLYRLGIPLNQVFSKYDRILYLDNDTLVCNNRIDDLLGTDLSGVEMAGVRDVWGDHRFSAMGLFNSCYTADDRKLITGRIGNSVLTRTYINAGVLLINVNEIRLDADWYSSRLDMLRRGLEQGKFSYIDQDFVNTAVRTRGDLCLVFNVIDPAYDSIATIRHYAGGHRDVLMARALSLKVV